jgi:3-dehydroquinate synthase
VSAIVVRHSRGSYPVYVEPGILARLGTLVGEHLPDRRVAMIADETVYQLYRSGRLGEGEGRWDGETLTFPAGERSKSRETWSRLTDELLRLGFGRDSGIVALGGGVAGDLGGFVAATYLRGVPFVQCPTTLLAMVDASVGGKVGVNLPRGKNLVGAFHQPVLVAIDTDTLATLPVRELRCGLAECVKHGVIRDAELFAWIEQHVDDILAIKPDVMVELVRWNVAIKAAVVMEDEKETGVRAHLNFGHTFAHAVEALQGYGKHETADPGHRNAPAWGGGDVYHHGEAVSLGMVAATRLAVDAGRCGRDVLDRLVALLDRIGLPTRAGGLPQTAALIESMRLDKKVAGGRIRLVLPRRMGAVSIVNDSDDGAIAAAWESLR